MKEMKREIAENILLPGDPKRAEYIAKNYLLNPKKFSIENRLNAYTGRYNSVDISVVGSGMGIPSVLLAADTLYDKYDVKNIIRIGTCGTAQKDINIGDMLIALGCSTTSGINRNTFGGNIFCPVADFSLLKTAVDTAKSNNISVRIGNLISTDLFYDIATTTNYNLWWDFGILGVEMEGAGLYTSALKHCRRALMICTVSDSIIDQLGMSPKQRETSLNDMIMLGLETILKFHQKQ